MTATAITVDTNARLLVTGASGQLGLLVLNHLLDTLHVAPDHIVAGSRNPDKLDAFAKRGVITRRLDFDDAASVEAAAQGVDRALVISSNDIFGRLAGQKIVVSALAKAGVKHILYTSLINLDNAIPFGKDDHVGTEAAIRESKVQGYTFLRNGLYFENDIGSITGAKHSGKWFSAAQQGKLAGISRDDLALANAAALASNNYDNQIYELSGVEGLTIEEIAANVSKAIGQPIEVVHVTVEGLAQGIAAATGLPDEVAKAIASFDTNRAEGHAALVTSDFKKLVGRDPVTHAAWAEANTALLKGL